MDPGFINGNPSLLSSRSTDLEVHQERPITSEAWRVWKAACNLWCNIQTGTLHRPLGQWTIPGASLRRSWPYYWNPTTHRLIVRTADGYSTHRPFLQGPRGLRFKRQPNATISTLPSTCFPTDVLEYRFGFTKLLVNPSTSRHRIPTHTPPFTNAHTHKTRPTNLQPTSTPYQIF